MDKQLCALDRNNWAEDEKVLLRDTLISHRGTVEKLLDSEQQPPLAAVAKSRALS